MNGIWRGLLAITITASAGISRADDTGLIPRAVLFGNPDRRAVQVSHDGKQIGYLAPLDGVMNIWIAPADDLKSAKAVTHDKKRGISTYFWAYTNNDLIYLQDQNGDENWAVHQVNRSPGSARSS